MKPGIRVRALPGCPAAKADAVRRAARAVAAALPVCHPLEVQVSPAGTVFYEGGLAVGLFVYSEYPPRIILAAGPDAVWPMIGGGRRIVCTFLHEWVHYEQWRDGRPLTERGVNVRARNLMRKLRLSE